MTNNFSEILRQMAILFSYPQETYRQTAETLSGLLPAEHLKTAQKFLTYCASAPFAEIEEHFTKTFDMNPDTCLEIGWHLFGEDYKRGQFLVYMRQSLAARQIPESVELPDHLSHCLRFLAVLDRDEAKTYAQSYLVLPLQKMMSKMDKDNPYYVLLNVLFSVLKEELLLSNNDQAFASGLNPPVAMPF